MFSDSEILKAIFEKTPYGLAIRDTDGGYYNINKKFTEITGYDFSDLVDITYLKISNQEPGINENLLITSLASTDSNDWNGEFRYIHKSGRIIIVNQWVEKFDPPPIENINLHLVYIEDITEKKQNELLFFQKEKRFAIEKFYRGFSQDIDSRTLNVIARLNKTKNDLANSKSRINYKTLYWVLDELESKMQNLKLYLDEKIKSVLNDEDTDLIVSKTSLKDNWIRTFENIKLINSNVQMELFDCAEDEILPLSYSDLFQLIWNLYLISIHQGASNSNDSEIIFRRETVDSFEPSMDVWIGNHTCSGFLLRIQNNSKYTLSSNIWKQLIDGNGDPDHPYTDKFSVINSILLENDFGLGYHAVDYEYNEFILFIPGSVPQQKNEGDFQEYKKSLKKRFIQDQKNKEIHLFNSGHDIEPVLEEVSDLFIAKPIEILYILKNDSDIETYREIFSLAGYMSIEEIAENCDFALEYIHRKSFQLILYKQEENQPIEWEKLTHLRSILTTIPIIIHSNSFSDIKSYNQKEEFHFGFITNESLTTLPFIIQRDLKYSRSMSEKIMNLSINRDLIHPEDIDNVLFFFFNMRKAEKGKTYRINYRSKNKKGDFIHLENTSQVLEFNNQGSAKKILNSIRDRTDYFKYLELTNQSVKKTRSISEAKTKFLANISHELKTPLNSILGYSEFLQMPGMSPLSEQQKLYIETIHKDGQYLLNLMNQILDYSKTEMNKFQIHLTKTNLNSLLSEIVNSFLIITQEKEVIILFNDDANVPRIEIDPIRMREVISNLINNAIKFSDPGMEIAVHLHEDLENIYISISDQGIGIQQKDLEKIFEPFEQIQTEKSVKNDGIGLGLSLSKKIVEMHKGKLTVESKIGKGSCFTICLPRPYQLK